MQLMSRALHELRMLPNYDLSIRRGQEADHALHAVGLLKART